MPDCNHILSIVVVTYNEAAHVARLKRSIDALHIPDGVSTETLLVDGGSSDGTPDEALAVGFNQVIVRKGASIPVCRNLGAASATGDWLAYVDGDCELASDWLEQAYPFLKDSAPVILGWPARPPEPMNWMQTAWNFHWLNKNPRMENYLGRPVVRREGFRLSTTRNMQLNRTVFDQMGGFNEELPTGEDTDFAFRAYMAGIAVLGLPESKVIHHGEPTTLREFYRQQKWHANRRSYQHIQKLSGNKIGGNAPRYTALYLGSLMALLVGVIAFLITRHPLAFLLLLPLPGVISAPAAWISLKGRTLRYFPALCVIYAVYGWARALDLIGLAREKPSWKKKRS